MEHTLELLSECAPLLILAGAAVGWRAAIARWTLGVQGALMITMCAMCALKIYGTYSLRAAKVGDKAR